MAEAAAQTGTRDRVLALLLELGPSTTSVLADRLGLSAAGVRRHLDALLDEGTVATSERRTPGQRGRGRPARVWALTDAGHAAGPSAYDDLAAGALRFLSAQAGEAAVEAFAAARVAELEARYRDSLAALPTDERPAALAAALTADGYAAGTTALSTHLSASHSPAGAGIQSAGAGIQLCQHHCPVRHVAQEFPQLCDAETAAIGRLLDVHVQRLATIAHGDGVCTTFIPYGGTPPVQPDSAPRKAAS